MMMMMMHNRYAIASISITTECFYFLIQFLTLCFAYTFIHKLDLCNRKSRFA
jgi:hypothetical protein